MSKIPNPGQIYTVSQDRSNLQTKNTPPNPPPNTIWIGGYKLGVGGYGVATLWILVDRTTLRAIDRVVIKDAFERSSAGSTLETGIYKGIYRQLEEKGLDFGADPTNKIGHADARLRFLREAYLQGLMTEPDADDEIYASQLWGYARKLLNNPYSPNHDHWRLYMSLYDYGDLGGLIRAHTIERKAIPEPFIWHTLICLMKAAAQLETQARLRPNNTNSDVIVVCDMKPGNILLAAPDQTSMFPIYPRPHIADLGGGVLTNKDDYENRTHRQRIAYTRGYKAPEMWRPSHGLPANATIFPSAAPIRATWTNVWQIGRVLEQMMKLYPKLTDMDYQPGRKEEAMTPEIINWPFSLPGQKYSMILRRTVAQCLRFHPKERPSPQMILRHLEMPGYGVYYDGMDTFGNDAWFQQQQMKRAAAGPKNIPVPTTPLEAAAIRDAETETQRRLYQAQAYLRA
ncbi:hypothetical protein E4T49_06429 [Aureobasidium sp. EXF-10728]|nr:hypothetical protein E4T49_06429 [Aureobasidium sp. EXF-10728]